MTIYLAIAILIIGAVVIERSSKRRREEVPLDVALMITEFERVNSFKK